MTPEQIKDIFNNWRPKIRTLNINHYRGSKKGECEKIKRYKLRLGGLTSSIEYAFEDYLIERHLNELSTLLNDLDYESKKKNSGLSA